MSRALLLGAAACWAATAWAQAPAPAAEGAGPRSDSLTAAARRAAAAWQRHDFAALVAGSPGLMVRLGRAAPSAPMPPAQAALALRTFAADARELATEVTEVREVDATRAYAEVQRTYTGRGTSARRTQTLYLGWRWVAAAPRLVEVRVVP